MNCDGFFELAKEDDAMDCAISSVWQLTEDQKIREQMRRREENEREWNHREELLQNALQEVDVLKEENEQLKKQIAMLENNTP